MAHIRAQGVALFNYKKNYLIDDRDHLIKSRFLKQTVRKVKAGKIGGMSRALVEVVRRVIGVLAKHAAIIKQTPKPIKYVKQGNKKIQRKSITYIISCIKCHRTYDSYHFEHRCEWRVTRAGERYLY